MIGLKLYSVWRRTIHSCHSWSQFLIVHQSELLPLFSSLLDLRSNSSWFSHLLGMIFLRDRVRSGDKGGMIPPCSSSLRSACWFFPENCYPFGLCTSFHIRCRSSHTHNPSLCSLLRDSTHISCISCCHIKEYPTKNTKWNTTLSLTSWTHVSIFPQRNFYFK